MHVGFIKNKFNPISLDECTLRLNVPYHSTSLYDKTQSFTLVIEIGKQTPKEKDE